MHTSRGFTLIELLVVIAVIGLLSAVVLGALKDARLRAEDTAVKRHVQELSKVMAKELNDTGSYTAIKTGGGSLAANPTCAAATFSGTYITEAAEICNALKRSTGPACGANCVRFYAANQAAATNKFSIWAYLPGESTRIGSARYYCLGSNGRTSSTDTGTFTAPGCSAATEGL